MTFVTTQPNVQVQWPSLLQKFKVQSYEKGYLEIHHSDRSGHLDRHRHQPGGYQLHLLKGATPDPSIREGDQEERGAHP